MSTPTKTSITAAHNPSPTSDSEPEHISKLVHKMTNLHFAAIVGILIFSVQCLIASSVLAEEKRISPSHIFLVQDLGIYVPAHEAFVPQVTLCRPPKPPPTPFDPCKICNCCIEKPTQLTASQFADHFFSTNTKFVGKDDLSVNKFGIAVKNEFTIPGMRWNSQPLQMWEGTLDSKALVDNWVGKKPVYGLETHQLFEHLGKHCK